MSTAVAYSRVSTEDQARHGVSLADQQARLLEALPGASLLADEGQSTKTPLGKRPAGALLVESVENGTCKTVLCTRLDRLFRNAAEALTTVSYWQRIGVSLIVLDLNGTGTVDVCSPNGWLMFSIKAAFDEFERRTISQRTKAALAHVKSTGKELGRPDRWSHSPAHAQALTAARELQLTGLTLTEVADVLNQRLADGSPNAVVPVRGSTWSRYSIHRLLKTGETITNDAQ